MIWQTYILNNSKTVHLKPRPLSKEKKLAIKSKVGSLSHEFQIKETKTSTSRNKLGGICEECGKHLQDKRKRFCSVRCKVNFLSLNLMVYK
jgi:hydrogenase maturation factor HypF (carbamoyltransferase family)